MVLRIIRQANNWQDEIGVSKEREKKGHWSLEGAFNNSPEILPSPASKVRPGDGNE